MMPITREQLLIPGARFRVVTDSYHAKQGDIVRLAEDDGTDLPYFHSDRALKAGYRVLPIPLSRLDLIDPAPAQPAVAATGDGGKTLLDEFAMAALVGIGDWCPVSASEFAGLRDASTLKRRAEWAYEQAEAMLAAREAVQR